MKKFSLFRVVLLCVGILFVQVRLSPASALADRQDYTRWNLPEGALVRLGKGRISELAYSPDGTRLAVVSSIGIWLYDAHTGDEVALLTGHTDRVSSVSFSPDGLTLASGSDDNRVKLWDVASGELKATLTGHTDRVSSVSFSPDGLTLASGSRDRTVKLWDVSSGQEKATLTGHSVSFSPDGLTLASGSGDGTILLWDMTPYIIPQSSMPDFDGDGTVGFADFLLFVNHFGTSRGDAGYDLGYDLDGDGTIGFGDFLIFASAFGKKGS